MPFARQAFGCLVAHGLRHLQHHARVNRHAGCCLNRKYPLFHIPFAGCGLWLVLVDLLNME